VSCPFLRETKVRTCHAAPLRKMIADGGNTLNNEKCHSQAHAECPVFQERGGEPAGPCPHLDERLVQYCGAAPVARYVPYSPAEATRCGSEAYKYCDAWLALARPHGTAGAPQLDGVVVPENLYYAPNHLWLDAGQSGLCHIGVDGLLARLLGKLDRVSFLTPQGTRRPAAIATVCGVDWPLVFPSALQIDRSNSHLRADPSRITRDPYGAGWLYAGWIPPGEDPARMLSNLVQGRQATAWMSQEAHRLSEWVQRQLSSRMGEPQLACDGGWIVESVAHLLRREELLDVLHEFFAPYSGWTKES